MHTHDKVESHHCFTLDNKTSIRQLEEQAQKFDKKITNEFMADLLCKFAETEESLFSLNQEKNLLMGVVAHDLRNPLGTINGFAEMLLEDNADTLDPDSLKFLENIRSLSRFSLNLVNDILDLTAIESGTTSLSLEAMDFEELIKERINILELVATRKKTILNFNSSPLPSMRLDRSKMVQVIDNLLSNAIKYSPPESQIKINLFQKEEQIVFEVQDQGPGLSAQDLQKVFGEFQKLSAKPTSGEKSTGLGLAIVRRIILAHGGEVEAKNIGNNKNGAIFSFWLPFDKIT